jgi:hypothetical protein
MLGQGPFGQPNLAALAAEGGISIALSLVPSATVVHTPILMVVMVNQPILMDLVASTTSFPALAVTLGGEVIPETVPSSNQFYGITVEHQLGFASPFTNENLFYAPTVTAIPNLEITPTLVPSGNTFGVPFVDTAQKLLELLHTQSTTRVHELRVVRIDPPYVYEYPIGRDLESDYGIRASITSYKQRLVLGHRYGRRSRH